MKIEEYIKNLQEIALKYPNLDVIYAADDEGNDYGEVYFSPTLGKYKDREWIPESQFQDYIKEDSDYEKELKVNAVCVN